MVVITKLADIDIYRKALIYAQDIYKLTREPPLTKDYSLIDQVRRACLSVAANIAEGYGRKSKKDFAQFLSIALGSTNELMAFLDFIELEYKIDTKELSEKYDTLAKRIFTFRKYLLTHNS